MPFTAQVVSNWLKKDLKWTFAATVVTWPMTAFLIEPFCMKKSDPNIPDINDFIEGACNLPHKNPPEVCIEGMQWGSKLIKGSNASSTFPNITAKDTTGACRGERGGECNEQEEALWLSSMLEAISAKLPIPSLRAEHDRHMARHESTMWGTLFVTTLFCMLFYKISSSYLENKAFYQQHMAAQFMLPMIFVLVHALMIFAQTPKNTLPMPGEDPRLISGDYTACHLEEGLHNNTACITASIEGARYATTMELDCTANNPFPDYTNPYKGVLPWCGTRCNGWQSGFYKYMTEVFVAQCLLHHDPASLPAWGAAWTLLGLAICNDQSRGYMAKKVSLFCSTKSLDPEERAALVRRNDSDSDSEDERTAAENLHQVL